MISLKQILSKSTLARNTVYMLGGRGVRMVIQAIYFLVIARALGASQYGAFVGAVSLVAIAVPFSSWGMGFILIRKVSRDRTAFRRSWGDALCVTLISGGILLGLAALSSRWIWGRSIPVSVLLLVGLSDLFAVRLVDLATQAFVAVELLRKTAEVNVILSLSRMLGAMVLLFSVAHPTASSWTLLYLGTGVIAATYSFVAVTRTLGLPEFGLRMSRAEFKEGFYFAIGLASQTIYNDVDKTMLVRLSGLEAAGIYGAAYRIIDALFAPISSLVYAAYARFFRHGAHGISEGMRFARKLLVYSIPYGLLTAATLALASPVLPKLLGADFADSGAALRWLSPLILFKCIHYFYADSLAGAGFQGIRAAVQLGVAGVNVVVNLWLIPAYSWRGAAWASLVSDGLLLVCLWAVTHGLTRKESTQLTMPLLQCAGSKSND